MHPKFLRVTVAYALLFLPFHVSAQVTENKNWFTGLINTIAGNETGRYQILTGGSTVKDLETGLVWQRCSVGQSWDGSRCLGDAQVFKWNDAQKLSGNGWRVPTVRELQSLRVCSKGFESTLVDFDDGGAAVLKLCKDGSTSPTIDTKAFPKTPAYRYWTSSPVVGDSGYAWFVSFYHGYVGYDHRGYSDRVRLVR